MRAVVAASRQGATAFAAVKAARGVHLAARRLIVCESEQQRQQGEPPAATTQQPPVPPAPAAAARPSIRSPGPQQRMPPPSPMGNLKIERVEQLGESRFSGVVSLDDGEAPANPGKVALLVGGDAAALLLFASIGRLSHGEGWSLVEALGTAWPFMAGWFAAATLLGAFGKAAQGGSPGAAAGAAAKAWAVGIPAGLLVRAASRGYFPEPTFIGVSMAANAVFLIGWRTALAAATPEAPEAQNRREELAARKDRKGNPLEMFTMIFSMVKRW